MKPISSAIKAVVAAAVAAAASAASACSGFYIGKGASADGRMYVGRTQDSPPWNLCFRVVKKPGGEYGPCPYIASLQPTSTGRGRSINTARNGGKDDGKYHFCATCVNENGESAALQVTYDIAPVICGNDETVKKPAATIVTESVTVATKQMMKRRAFIIPHLNDKSDLSVNVRAD